MDNRGIDTDPGSAMNGNHRERARLRAKEAQRARAATVREQRLQIAAIKTEIARREAIDRAKEEAAAPAALEACASCPWRRDNQRDDSDPWLSDAYLMSFWDEIRSGGVMVCHKTCVIPEVVTDEAAAHGWAPTPEHARKRECAGALAQMLKEERLRDELGSYGAYFAKRGPFGVTPDGFEVHARRRAGEISPPLRELTGLDQYGRPWFPAPAGQDTMPVVPPCACPVCTRHEEAHDALALTHPGTGDQISVDAGLAPVVEALWRSGAITLASCENLTDALRRLWPAQLPELEQRSFPVEFNYQHTVRNDLAFIRGVDSLAWAPISDVVAALDGGQVMRWGPGIHLAFRLEDVPRLLEAL